jgi:hypothetical protein
MSNEKILGVEEAPVCEHGHRYYCGHCRTPRGTKFPIKGAVTCRLCQSPADREERMFVCQSNRNHVADLITGIFSDVSFPGWDDRK